MMMAFKSVGEWVDRRAFFEVGLMKRWLSSVSVSLTPAFNHDSCKPNH